MFIYVSAFDVINKGKNPYSASSASRQAGGSDGAGSSGVSNTNKEVFKKFQEFQAQQAAAFLEFTEKMIGVSESASGVVEKKGKKHRN